MPSLDLDPRQRRGGRGLVPVPAGTSADRSAERSGGDDTAPPRRDDRVARADLPPEADRPWWREWFRVSGAIDLSDPPACQVFWYPAN